ncbi:MAG TPA: hypothetical protein VD815_09330 [Candidatus Saccharimonadales bacterium]|nr:hypothetical protein [Candidatus Saccharimonadales bacterium]
MENESHQIENTLINYVILAIAFVFEANAIRIAFALFRKTIKERGDKLTSPVLIKEL